MYLIENKLCSNLPFRITTADGFTRTNLSEKTIEELLVLGIYPVDENKPELSSGQYYGEPTITITDGRALAEYPVLDYSEEQLAERLTTAKEAKKSEIAAARYEAEIAGVMLNGMLIRTDRESRSLLTSACLQAVIDPEYTLNWKTADGTFIRLSAEDIKAVGTTVRVYVQSQFDEEERLCGVINAATTAEELEAITWTSVS